LCKGGAPRIGKIEIRIYEAHYRYCSLQGVRLLRFSLAIIAPLASASLNAHSFYECLNLGVV
jgi:hypothetical protein